MNKTRILIAKKTLKLLEKNSWEKISIDRVLGKENKIKFNSKKELLSNINRYIDYQLKKNLSSMEVSSTKDMVFEVIMARFDILNSHRTSIKNLINFFTSNPQEFIKSLPSFVESIILTASLANIRVNGIKGAANIKILFLIYLITIYTWRMDESSALEKTMTNLDKYLIQIEKITPIFK